MFYCLCLHLVAFKCIPCGLLKYCGGKKNSCTFLTSSTNQVLEERLSRNNLHCFILLSFLFILCWNFLPCTENNRSPSASFTMEIVNHMLWPLQSPFCVSSHSPPLPSNTKWGNIFWKHRVPPLSLNSENKQSNCSYRQFLTLWYYNHTAEKQFNKEPGQRPWYKATICSYCATELLLKTKPLLCSFTPP